MARAALRRDYEDYLHRQRGLSSKTIASCWYVASRFELTARLLALEQTRVSVTSRQAKPASS
jgi:hypothetical protein